MLMKRVMVVEDEAVVALNLRQRLEKLGYEVAAIAATGGDALQQISILRPDIVLMDIHLQGDIDGIETASQIPPDMMVPVIYLTAHAEESTLSRARTTKPYGYLLKPFSERELHATISMALERRASDWAVRQSEERLRLAFAAAEMGSWEVNTDTQELQHQPYLVPFASARHETITQSVRSFIETIHDDDRDAVRAAFDCVADIDRLIEIEFRHIAETGEIRWLRVVGRSFREPPDRRLRIVGVVRDITDLKQANALRQASEQRYSDIIAAIDGIVWEADFEKNHVTYVSESAQRILGYSPKEWIETENFWEGRLLPADAAAAIATYQQEVSAGRSYANTYRIRATDGRPVWIHEVVSVTAHRGKQTLLRGVMVDITKLKQTEEELQRTLDDREKALTRAESASLAKSSFLAIMSHELRTPLNAIIGFSDMMQRGVFGPIGNEKYQQYVTDIYDSGQMLLAHVNGILDLSRIESGKQDLDIQAHSLDDCWQVLGPPLTQLARQRQIRLTALSSSHRFLADRDSILRVLSNLITNALKFTAVNGSVVIEVRTDSDAGRIIISVVDTGRGIPQDRLDDVFKPFVQLSDYHTRDVGGVGLGLAICKSLVDAMSGYISIESEVDKGTRVSVSLPAALSN